MTQNLHPPLNMNALDELSHQETQSEDNSSRKDYNKINTESFEDLNLKDNVLRGIYGNGYEQPSVIQKKAILPIIDGNDLIAQAQSGTGKTATFTIGTLQRIDENEQSTQALILAHTRELALQILNVVQSISKYMDLTTSLCVGGTLIRDNIDELLKNPHIVIGTPGRVLDMINKKALNTRTLKLLVIDEADEMLSKIFSNQIYDIFRFLPNSIQVGLFSATMTDEFFKLSKCFMRDPVKILVKNEELTLEGIRQFYINIEKGEYKFDTLCDIYEACSISQTIIYCNSKRSVDDISRKLNDNNFSIASIHGEMSQDERNKIMKEFRDGTTRILISTDLLSRGIDVQQVSLVINFDVPNNIECYIHRIGRSGRYGRKGVAINFLTNYDYKKMEEIEKYYSTQVEELPGNFKELLA
jgi:translation initiation factor 4A